MDPKGPLLPLPWLLVMNFLFFGARKTAGNLGLPPSSNPALWSRVGTLNNPFGRRRTPPGDTATPPRRLRHFLPRFDGHAFVGAEHQLKHRVREKVSLKVAEKLVHQLVPRIMKRTGKELLGRVLWRKLARGLAVAIPAIGGIFSCIIFVVDLRRAAKERREGNSGAHRLFRLAAIFDILDVLCHAFIASGLAGFFFQLSNDPILVYSCIHSAGAFWPSERLFCSK